MSKDEGAIEPGYYSDGIDPGDAERLVLRFPQGDLFALPGDGEIVRLELSLKGRANSLVSWKLSVRRSEGILVLADEGTEVVVAEARIYVPALFRDIEMHTASGNLEIRGIAADLLASSGSGDIRVSGGSSLEASSDSGNIEVEGSGNLTARLGSGSLRCRSISGAVNAETQSGDASVESASGNVVVVSVSGDVSILKPGGRLRVASATGDLELELSGRFAGGEVSSSSGDISLSLCGADLELRAETLSGELDAPGAEVVATTGPRRCALKLGAGGRRLHVRSVSGDIEIEN